MSATGTYTPSIWQKELPNWIFAMSFRPGTFDHPARSGAATESLTVAPHRGQLN
jgi:hypothetical protein